MTIGRRTAAGRTSDARGVLALANFRRYVYAQLSSGAGMWNQRVAELWLLLELTGDGLSLGLGTALRTAPAIFLARPAGWLADRYDRQLLLTSTQAARGVVGGTMAVVVMVGRPPLMAVYLLIFILGIVNALDGPMRRSFVRDVVDEDHLQSAAGLHTATISVGRIAGPLVAGAVIALWGLEWAFAVSVATAAMAIAAVRSIRPLAPTVVVDTPRRGRRTESPTSAPAASAPLGLSFSDVLVLLGAFSVFGWNVDVVLPLLATDVLGHGPVAFSGLVICLSVGTLIGSVVATGRPHSGRTRASLVVPLLAFAATLPLVVASTHIAAIALALIVAGGWGGLFLSASNAALQLVADPARQGRMVANYSIVFTGSRAVGAPVLGWAVDRLGPRLAVVAVGVVTATSATLAATVLSRRAASEPTAEGQPLTDGAS